MKIQERAVLHNRFDVKVVEAVSGKIKQTAVGFNVITNYYFNSRLTGSPLVKRLTCSDISRLVPEPGHRCYRYSSFLAFNTQSRDNVGNGL
jgi:hypothetical protein